MDKNKVEVKSSVPEEPKWKKDQKVGSRFITITPANEYNPEPKPPSKRDKHRQEVAARKQK